MMTRFLVFTCDWCGASVTESKQFDLYPWEPLINERPDGWSFVGEKIACPKHVITVKTKEGESP